VNLEDIRVGGLLVRYRRRPENVIGKGARTAGCFRRFFPVPILQIKAGQAGFPLRIDAQQGCCPSIIEIEMDGKIQAQCINELVKSRIPDGFVKSPRSRLANPEE
jgi:hypothetical protein